MNSKKQNKHILVPLPFWLNSDHRYNQGIPLFSFREVGIYLRAWLMTEVAMVASEGVFNMEFGMFEKEYEVMKKRCGEYRRKLPGMR